MRSDISTRVELRIDAIGHRGDGIAATDAGPVYVPFTLPGEHVAAEVRGDRGTLVEVLQASPDRVEPVCPHFGTCGGCLLQHMAGDAYLEFKRALLVSTLRSHDLDIQVDRPVPVPVASRRRATFSAKRAKTGHLAFGFTGRKSHDIVAIETCPILVPAIAERLEDLRALAGIACGGKKPLKLQVTATGTGLDVLVIDGRQDETTRARLSREALQRGLARISFSGDVIVEPVAPALSVGAVTIQPKPGTFLQAAAESEEILASIAVDALGNAGSKSVADLFCGVGAFALRIARFAKVTGVDADADALFCIDRALRHATGLKPVALSRRDLFRNPMTDKELNLFDAVIFDPPRAGAERQAVELAKSKVKTIVAVSCNPLTFARDLAVLAARGYRIGTIRPVDQFVFSSHIEAVAVCERPK